MPPVPRPLRTLRRRLAAALLGGAVGLLALSGGPAWAADTVQGSPQPDGAPQLTAGSFTDSVKAGETLYYAVTLQTGQSAKARFTVDGTANTETQTGGGEVWSVTEDGDEFAFDNACCHKTDVWTMTTSTGVVGPDSSHAKDPGTYYFKYHLKGYAAGLTFPVKITVLLTGEGTGAGGDQGSSAPAGSSPSDGATQGVAADSSDGPGAGDPPQTVAGGTAAQDTGLRFGLPVVLGVGGAGLFAGVVGGAVVTVAIGNARRPRRPY